MLAVLALLGSGFLLARAAASTEPSRPAAGHRHACDVSILLVGNDRSPTSEAIDRASGRGGWVHAALDGCEVDEHGRHVGLDCRVGAGVQRRPLADIIAGAPVARIHLPLAEGRELYGCVRGRLGAPYDLLGVVAGPWVPPGGYVCSTLIADCLPAALRSAVPMPRRRAIAPNDIARAFRVTGPGDYWIGGDS